MTAAVFFGGDFANPDTYQKFWTDMQMYTTTMTQPDPQYLHGAVHCSWEFAQKANKWASRNISRWRNDEYDEAHKAAQVGTRPGQARGAVHQDERPGVQRQLRASRWSYRPRVSAAVNKLSAPLSGWDNDLWALPHWFKDA